MNDEYLIVFKSILPDFYDDVLNAKSFVEDEKFSVSDACRKVGISRSTYYKYRDKIFRATKNYGKKSIIGIRAKDKKGVLSEITSEIYKLDVNILSINFAMPIRGVSYVTLAIDVSEAKVDTVELVDRLKNINNIKSASIIAIE